MKLRALFTAALLLAFLAGCTIENGRQEIPSPAIVHAHQEQQSSKSNDVLIIATGDMSGVYFSLGQGMADLYEKYNGMASGTQVTNASFQNTKLVSRKNAELGFATIDALGLLEKQKRKGEDPQKTLRALTSLYPNYIQIVTTEKSGIHSLMDLTGKKVSVGSIDSGTKLIAERTLQAVGLTSNHFKKLTLSFSQSADALRNGNIDAAFFVSGLPNPEITSLSAELPIKLIPVPEKIVNRLQHQFGYYSQAVIPPETYEGQQNDISTFAIKNVLFTNKDMSNKEAYNLVKTLYEHLPELEEIHPSARDIKLLEAKTGIPLKFHPGAEKYFSEHGVYH
ncbi:TAXI family TRAP transporter solute-binding subunit [Neobacillus pocheonensis]|uniref:TAXI family TRAP transporter solute-binding subunit n=1 Tax=Neobacillus pocheonensis TaxID=363869 RepID=UPI003D2AFB59